MYVSIFVKLAKDTYHKKFNDKSVFCLLGALRGVAAIGHILVKDALESVDNVEYGPSSYSLLVQDTDDSWHEFEQNINNLEHKFRAVLKSNSKIYEVRYIVCFYSLYMVSFPFCVICCNLTFANMFQLLRPTMEEAIALTILFISQMVTRHERMLGYIPSKYSFPFVWHENIARQNTICYSYMPAVSMMTWQCPFSGTKGRRATKASDGGGPDGSKMGSGST